MTLKLGDGLLSRISKSTNTSIYRKFDKKMLNSLVYGIRRTKKYDMNEKDKFGKDLAIGDTIIVCYSKMGRLSKATILGEKDKTWKIRVEMGYVTQDKTIDKNPERIIKYDG